VAIGGETFISGRDLSNTPLLYQPGYEQVYLNGSLLLRGIDYIATNGTTITGLGALLASDVIEVIAPSGVAVGDYYTQSQADAKFATTDQTSTPVASVLSYAAANAPSGWLLCDGKTYSFAAYPALAGLLLGTYGGNGTTTFAVPDLRGRTVAGRDNMGGTTAARITAAVSGVTGTTLGAAGGDERLHQHLHANTVTNGNHGHTWSGQNSDLNNIGQAGNYPFKIAQDLTTQWTGTTGNIGSSGSIVSITNVNAGLGTAQNLPPTMVLNYIIKAS
jgi:microcystin-dependent protein